MINENKVVVNFNGESTLNRYAPAFVAVESDVVSTIITNPNDFEIKVRFLVDKANITSEKSGLDCRFGVPTHETISKLSPAAQKSKSLLWDYPVAPNDFVMLRHLRMEPGDVSLVQINSENPNAQAKVEVASQLDRRTNTSVDTLINDVNRSIDKLVEAVDNLNTSMTKVLTQISTAIQNSSTN